MHAATERFYDTPTDVAAAFPMLRKYLGAVRFDTIMRDCKSTQVASLPALLNTVATEDVHEIACFEAAVQAAMEAPDMPTLALRDFPQRFDASQRFTFHPSWQRLQFTQNTTTIWASLKSDQVPPRPFNLEQPQTLMIWSHREQPRFRTISEDEDAALQAAKRGLTYNGICGVLANRATTEPYEARATIYLRGWFEAEMLLKGGAKPAEKRPRTCVPGP
jgi:hypothetical protein